MRSVSVLLVAMIPALMWGGCSEKQKEAARLEAAMKNGDSIVPEMTSDSDLAASSNQFDSAVAQISAQISGSGSASPVDSQVTDSGNSPGLTEVSQLSDSATGMTNHSPAVPESTEQVMDAGAIPLEEMPKSAPPTTGSGSVKTMDEPPTAAGYVVQIASTPDESEATMLVAKFVKGGYRAFKAMAVVEGTTYYRVRVGRYDSVVDAEAALSELHEKYKVNGFVTSVR